MATDKTVVIERIWAKLQAETPPRRMVLQKDVTEAIEFCNANKGTKLSVNNPANFLKDVVRGDDASSFWPSSLTALRIGAEQRPRDKRVFEFVDFGPGQSEAFPNIYTAKPGMSETLIETVSIPIAMRRLGRADESWLVQVAVRLRLVEAHFATNSALKVQEINHLQIGVKLGPSEIDSLYLGSYEDGDKISSLLITCEAKQEGQRILDTQIAEQVVAAAKSIRRENIFIDTVVGVGMKVIPESRIYVCEFAPIPAAAAEAATSPLPQILASEGLYRLKPPVKGLGYEPPRPPHVKL